MTTAISFADLSTLMHKLSVLFWLRKDKQNKIGECPVYCRITVNGDRAPEFSIGEKLTESEWDSKLQTSTNEEVNGKLNFIRNKIKQKFYDLGGEVTAKDLKDAFFGNIPENKSFAQIAELYQEYINDIAGKPERMGLGTHARYSRWLAEVTKFFTDKYSDTPAKNYHFPHMETLKDHWLMSEYEVSVINKRLTFVKQVFKWSVLHGHIPSAPVREYPLMKLKLKPKVQLTTEEMSRIEQFKFPSQKLQEVADLFIFQCYTGVAYVDLMNFTEINICELELDGETIPIIEYFRSKTDEKAQLPALPQAIGIISKYQGKLPKISNQRYNDYLKTVAGIVGITKNITTHVGRKTFAQVQFDQGIYSLPTIASFLGHANTKTTTNSYININQGRMLGEIREHRRRHAS